MRDPLCGSPRVRGTSTEPLAKLERAARSRERRPQDVDDGARAAAAVALLPTAARGGASGVRAAPPDRARSSFTAVRRARVFFPKPTTSRACLRPTRTAPRDVLVTSLPLRGRHTIVQSRASPARGTTRSVRTETRGGRPKRKSGAADRHRDAGTSRGVPRATSSSRPSGSRRTVKCGPARAPPASSGISPGLRVVVLPESEWITRNAIHSYKRRAQHREVAVARRDGRPPRPGCEIVPPGRPGLMTPPATSRGRTDGVSRCATGPMGGGAGPQTLDLREGTRGAERRRARVLGPSPRA